MARKFKRDERLDECGNDILAMLKSHRYTKSYEFFTLLDITPRIFRMELENVKRYYPVCNFQDGNGFFIAKTKSDAEHQYNQESKRARKIFYNLSGLKAFINIKNNKKRSKNGR